MKTKTLLFCFSIAVIPFLDGCKKYPDGPSFTLRTVKGRITNQWTKKASLYNGQPAVGGGQHSGSPGEDLDIKKDGSYIFYGGIGKWTLSSDKQTIIFGSEDYKILKLTSKELWLYYEYSNYKKEWHYDKK